MLFRTDYKNKIAEDRYCTSPGAADNNDLGHYGCDFGANSYYFLSTYKNVDRALMQGLDFSGSWRIVPNLRLSGSYSYTASRQKTGDYAGQPLNKLPRHMLNAMLDWQATDRLNAWVQGSYRGKTSNFLSRTTMDEGTPGYGLIDIGLVYRVGKNTKLKAGVYNVANKKITNDTYGVVLDGRRITVGLSASF